MVSFMSDPPRSSKVSLAGTGATKKSLYFVITLLACITLAACLPNVRGVVLFVGDSLMDGACADISRRQLHSNESVLPICNPIVGSELSDNPYWTGRLASIQERIVPDMLFVSLGTNDARNEDFASYDFPAMINTFMGSIDSSVRVYWILPHNTGITNMDVVITAILSAQDSWSNLTVVNFPLEPEHIQADGIHLTDQGNAEWAGRVNEIIDAVIPRESG